MGKARRQIAAAQTTRRADAGFHFPGHDVYLLFFVMLQIENRVADAWAPTKCSVT
jgi:hypothetical protein